MLARSLGTYGGFPKIGPRTLIGGHFNGILILVGYRRTPVLGNAHIRVRGTHVRLAGMVVFVGESIYGSAASKAARACVCSVQELCGLGRFGFRN